MNRTDNKTLNLADSKAPSRTESKVPSFLKPLQSFAPKLRETGSTQCQSPKANMLKMKQTKV